MFFEMVSEDLGCDLSLLPLVYIRINSTEAHKGQQYKTIGREAISFEFFLHFFFAVCELVPELFSSSRFFYHYKNNF